MGFFDEMPTAEWQAAPLLIPDLGSRAACRLTMELRSLNEATVQESCPIPHLYREVFDFAGRTCFTSIDVVSRSGQLPLHPDPYAACEVISPRGGLISKRVLNVPPNAVAYF